MKKIKLVEILTVIFAFIIFMIVLSKGYLAAIRPMSLIILIAISLVVGYVLASIVALLIGSALKIVLIIAIIAAVAVLINK